ncbi:MAG: signal recognition particle protein [Acidobacteria bacterium]|nr:MAG: signal recognition particle protein [Acidobacteriota bacterium]
MFDQLTDKLQLTFRNLRGKGKISEENIQDAFKQIRLALLEADVNYTVVKNFTKEIKEEALGQEVLKGLNPGEQLVKIVHDKLVETLGGESEELQLTGDGPHVILMVGLQGAGKTTTCGKLALKLKEQNRHPLLVPCDIYRPAARQQLQVVGDQVEVPVFDSTDMNDPVQIVSDAIAQARNTGRDIVLVDTAGRLHIDDVLMNELKSLKSEFQPKEILFVADSMTGQDAVQSGRAFHEALGVTGLILTKLDGDTRGGAALSVKQVTGQPIKFMGTGEKLDALEAFHPDRMASRILGMGDVLSLVERVQDKVDQDEAMALQKRMFKNQFNLEDFSKTLGQIDKMGDLGSLMSLVPGASQIKKKMDMQEEAKQAKRTRAMISSMTPEERRNHAILNTRRRQRIARGSGCTVTEVNQMLKQFVYMKKMMGMMTKPGKFGKLSQMFSRAGLGDFAKSMMPGMGRQQLPADFDEQKLMEIAEANGGKLPPEILKQMGFGSPRQNPGISRPKKDRKKQKAKRKKGRKRR